MKRRLLLLYRKQSRSSHASAAAQQEMWSVSWSGITVLISKGLWRCLPKNTVSRWKAHFEPAKTRMNHTRSIGRLLCSFFAHCGRKQIQAIHTWKTVGSPRIRWTGLGSDMPMGSGEVFMITFFRKGSLRTSCFHWGWFLNQMTGALTNFVTGWFFPSWILRGR